MAFCWNSDFRLRPSGFILRSFHNFVINHYLEAADWKGDKTKSFDTVVKRSGDRFTQMVKNTYRVLLTRGMKGCYVHFMDKNTENLFRSRVEHTGKVQ
jgi:DUF2075 family protein